MSEFQFQEDPEWSKYNRQGVDTYWDEAEHMPVLVQLLMKAGLGRRQAYYVLFGILVICLFVTFEVTKRTFFPGSSSQQTYIEDIPPEVLNTLPPEVVKSIPSRNAR